VFVEALHAAAGMCLKLGQQLQTLPETPGNACSLSSLYSQPETVHAADCEQRLTLPGWQVATPELGTLVSVCLKTLDLHISVLSTRACLLKLET